MFVCFRSTALGLMSLYPTRASRVSDGASAGKGRRHMHCPFLRRMPPTTVPTHRRMSCLRSSRHAAPQPGSMARPVHRSLLASRQGRHSGHHVQRSRGSQVSPGTAWAALFVHAVCQLTCLTACGLATRRCTYVARQRMKRQRPEQRHARWRLHPQHQVHQAQSSLRPGMILRRIGGGGCACGATQSAAPDFSCTDLTDCSQPHHVAARRLTWYE